MRAFQTPFRHSISDPPAHWSHPNITRWLALHKLQPALYRGHLTTCRSSLCLLLPALWLSCWPWVLSISVWKHERVKAHNPAFDPWRQIDIGIFFLPPANLRGALPVTPQAVWVGQPFTFNASSLGFFLLPASHPPILHFCSPDSHVLKTLLTQICFWRNLKGTDFRECNF